MCETRIIKERNNEDEVVGISLLPRLFLYNLFVLNSFVFY